MIETLETGITPGRGPYTTLGSATDYEDPDYEDPDLAEEETAEPEEFLEEET